MSKKRLSNVKDLLLPTDEHILHRITFWFIVGWLTILGLPVVAVWILTVAVNTGGGYVIYP